MRIYDLQQVETLQRVDQGEEGECGQEGKEKTRKRHVCSPSSQYVSPLAGIFRNNNNKKKTNMKKTISDRYRAEQRKQGQFLCTTLARDLLPVSVAVQIIKHVIKHVHAWSAFSIIGNNGHSFQGHLASEPQSFSVLRTEDAAGWRIGHAATLLLGIFF